MTTQAVGRGGEARDRARDRPMVFSPPTPEDAMALQYGYVKCKVISGPALETHSPSSGDPVPPARDAPG